MLTRSLTVVALIVAVGAAIHLRIDSLGSSTFDGPNGAVPHVANVSPGDPVHERVMPSVTLREGKRAVTMLVDAPVSVAGSMLPGGKVDVMLTLSRDGSPYLGVLLQGLRVLAIEQLSNDQSEKPIVSRSVTFEVDTEQAQKLALGAQAGRLSLNLMNSPHASQDGVRRIRSDDLLSPIRQNRPIRVYRGLVGDFPPYYGQR